MNRGFFGIGIYNSKTSENIGLLLRSAAVCGADFVFTVGRRFEKHPADTGKFYRHIPVFEFRDKEDFFSHIPYGCPIVAVELTGNSEDLVTYQHPASCIYLLGAEDSGIPDDMLDRCQATIQIPGNYCYNVAVAGSIVMYDRMAKTMLRKTI